MTIFFFRHDKTNHFDLSLSEGSEPPEAKEMQKIEAFSF